MNRDNNQLILSQSLQSLFSVEITADNSPTLRLKSSSNDKPESMHHSGGAATETAYIYTQPLEKTLKALLFKDLKQFNIAIVGLGVGYIETSLLGLLQKENFSNLVYITSFEKESSLILEFKNYFDQSGKNSVHQRMFQSVCEIHNYDENKLFDLLKTIIKNDDPQIRLDLKSELSQDTQLDSLFHYIAFDAFSQKTDHPLWTEEFLNYFIEQAASPDCLFTTYACTGLLKQTLKKHGFTLIPRLGFQGKRDSTLAVRGRFTQVDLS